MQRWQLGLVKAVVWVACLTPFVLLAIPAFELFGTRLTDPVAQVLDTLGKTGLQLLLITLAVTPLRIITGFNVLARFRRLLGLFAFFYIALHFVTFALLDLGLSNWRLILSEIVERPFITIGMLALLGLIPLAVTSTRGWQRRLGRRWVNLHKLIYPIAILGVWHYWWQVKADWREPALYAAILALLLGYRVWRSYRRRQQRAAAASAP